MPTAEEYREVLEAIYEDLPAKTDGVCHVCYTYTHKAWCWYPRLCEVLGKPLDKFDKEHLDRIKEIEK